MADKKKYPGWILAIDADYCKRFFTQGFNVMSLSRFIDGLPARRIDPKTKQSIPFTDDLASRVSMRERHRLEFDKNYLQPLNYMVLKQSQPVGFANREGGFCAVKREDFFSTYYRNKGVGEDRLADKMSVGWGGHSERFSGVFNEVGALDYIRTAGNNMITELNEECRLRVPGTISHEIPFEQVLIVFKGFIWDMSDDVGQHHLALVWEVTVPEGVVLESREDEHKLGPWCNRAELMADKNSRADKYENWSKIVIDQICLDGWDLLGTDKDWISKANAEAAYQTAEAELIDQDTDNQAKLPDDLKRGDSRRIDPVNEPAIDLPSAERVVMGLDLAEAGGDQTVIHDPISELSNTIGPKA
jgi:predicted NUDIX family phosphoesterase